MRVGMRCKAQTTVIAVAITRICNAAERPRPRLHTREGIVNTFSKLQIVNQAGVAQAGCA